MESDEEGEEEGEQKERSVLCVGLSTENMPLNARVGTVQKTIGYQSQGNLVINGKVYQVRNGAFGGSAVIGILCQIDDKNRLRTAFTLNGRLVAKPQPVTMYPGVQLYPTISISSPHVSVTVNFSAEEILYPPKCRYQELR